MSKSNPLHDENLAGLVATIWATSGPQFLTFYDRAAAGAGWVGALRYCAAAAAAFTAAEGLVDPDYAEVDWYSALDLMAEALIDSPDVLTDAELLDTALTVRYSLLD